MELNLENFNIRRSEALIVGSYNLPENTEKYTVKAQGLIGLDVYKDDKIKIINTEGGQVCEIIAFDNSGKNNQSIIGAKNNGDAKFIKNILTYSNDRKILLTKLKDKNINFNNSKSSNFQSKHDAQQTAYLDLHY